MPVIRDDYYLHYTSRQGAQSIEYTGQIEPGLDGYIYLSRDLFSRGSDAVNKLAIAGKAIELIALIPKEVLMAEAVEDFEPFQFLRDYLGRLLVRGGATRARTNQPIPSDRIHWMPLMLP